MRKCSICGGRLKEVLIDYKKEVLGDVINIPKVEGYECVVCGHTQVDEKIQDRLQIKVLEEKLRLRKEMKGKSKPILINNIKRIRTEKGISQKKIGQALGYTEQRFGAIERNDNTPIIYAVKQIADVLGVPDAELYTLKYIPMELYNILRDMDDEFKVIEGLPETRRDFEEYNEKYEKVKEEYNRCLSEKRQLVKRNKGKVNRIPFILTDEIRGKNEKRIEEIHEELEKLNQALYGSKNEKNKVDLRERVKELKLEEKRLQRELCGKVKTQKYVLTEELKRANTLRIEELDKEMMVLKAKISEMFKVRAEKKKRLDVLINGEKNKKGSVLKQGYCIDYYHYQKAKEIFAEYLKESE